MEIFGFSDACFQDLTISTKVQVGSRDLPTLINYTRDLVERLLTALRMYKPKRYKITILNNIGGVVKPGRFEQLHMSTKLKHGSTHSSEYFRGGQGGVSGRSKQSGIEEKNLKVILKLGMKPIPGVIRVTVKKSKNILFVTVRCEAAGLEDALCKRVMITPEEVIKRSLDPLSAAVSRDGLTKTLYSRYLC
ncbi:hypothetical protein AgCh_033336 [Apium graveolens]